MLTEKTVQSRKDVAAELGKDRTLSPIPNGRGKRWHRNKLKVNVRAFSNQNFGKGHWRVDNYFTNVI